MACRGVIRRRRAAGAVRTGAVPSRLAARRPCCAGETGPRRAAGRARRPAARTHEQHGDERRRHAGRERVVSTTTASGVLDRKPSRSTNSGSAELGDSARGDERRRTRADQRHGSCGHRRTGALQRGSGMTISPASAPPHAGDALEARRRRTHDQRFSAACLKSTRSRSSLPALKCGTCFSGTCTFSPDFGIATGARGAIVETEAAEPADLDAFPLREALGHRVEDHLDRELGVLGHQLRELGGQAVDQLRFGHRGRPVVSRWSCRPASP